MASKAALAVKDDVPLVPAGEILPTSFLEALKHGWKLEHETTTLGFDNRHRNGTATLNRPGFSKLLVPYTTSVEGGYTFGKPRLA